MLSLRLLLLVGKVDEDDLCEYLMRVTKLSQTKENLQAYLKARQQAAALDQDLDENADEPLLSPSKDKDGSERK